MSESSSLVIGGSKQCLHGFFAQLVILHKCPQLVAVVEVPPFMGIDRKPIGGQQIIQKATISLSGYILVRQWRCLLKIIRIIARSSVTVYMTHVDKAACHEVWCPGAWLNAQANVDCSACCVR